MDHFRYQFPLNVRFADIDMLGHVNHAKVFTYFETARMGYMREVLGWNGSPTDLTLILARAEADYKQPILMTTKTTVNVGVTRLGSSSFDMEYALTDEDGMLLAAGKTILVVFDYEKGTSTPIPDEWREKMMAYEPSLQGG